METFIDEPILTKEKDLANIIQKTTDKAYEQVARENDLDPSEVYYSKRCEQVSGVLRKSLVEQGIKAKTAEYKGWDITSHDVVIMEEQGSDTILDATWQQFLEKPNPTLPKVLISKRKDLDETLSRLGVPKEKHHIWKNAQTQISPSK